MADEVEVARLTKQIADAMLDARSAFQNLATDLEAANLPRTLERQLEGVEDLEASAARLRAREDDSAAAVGVEATREADGLLRTSFGVAQQSSGHLADAIRDTKNGLAAHGAALTEAAKDLDARLQDVDSLERLSGEETETTTELRTGLNGLKTAAENARAGTGLATRRLQTAQDAASQLAIAELTVDIHRRHSAAIASTATTVRAQVTNTGAVLENLRRDVYGGESAVGQATQHGVQADMAATAAAAAAAEKGTSGATNPEAANTGNIAGQLDPELAHVAQVGFVPRPAGPVDPRIAYSMGEQDRRPELGGPAKSQEHDGR